MLLQFQALHRVIHSIKQPEHKYKDNFSQVRNLS